MTEVASRELRNNTRSLLERVEAGEEITITVGGRPVAVLQPAGRRLRWLVRDEFMRRIVSHQADPRLKDELAELAPIRLTTLRYESRIGGHQRFHRSGVRSRDQC